MYIYSGSICQITLFIIITLVAQCSSVSLREHHLFILLFLGPTFVEKAHNANLVVLVLVEVESVCLRDPQLQEVVV